MPYALTCTATPLSQLGLATTVRSQTDIGVARGFNEDYFYPTVVGEARKQ